MRTADCLGGAIQFSDLDDGSVDVKEHGGRKWMDHVMSFQPLHSSIYVFPGSLVQHRPMNVTQGTRYSVVAFYRVTSSYIQFLSVWAGKQYYCHDCQRFYTNKRAFQVHQCRCTVRKKRKREQELLMSG